MEKLLGEALAAASAAGATYADARFVETKLETYAVKNEITDAAGDSVSSGVGVRVIADGGWGFASTGELTPGAVKAAGELAVRIARASSTAQSEPARLDDSPPLSGEYSTPTDEDPFEVGRREKIDMLVGATAAMKGPEAVKIRQAFMTIYSRETHLRSTEGADVHQRIVESGAGIAARAIGEGGESQVRSYPNSFRGNFHTAGFEYVRSLGLGGNAPRVADEAAQLLSAQQCPPGKRDVILDGGQLALQVHESCGHPIELDRVFGTEASYAGTSFLTTDKLGELQYGSAVVNIVADATVPGGLGTYGYDDEGVAAQRTDIVKAGKFVGYLTSRETAAKMGWRSSGAARADGWARIPLIRMTNINLLPGDRDFDELLADTDGGLFMATNRSWSIDNQRLNFQFGTEIAWEISGGRLGTVYKNPTYTGITPEFWNSCDAICSADHWQMWGTPNCGKGEPGQTAHVGHGAAPARFRGVQVGVIE